jgi:hypothetical protein
MELRFFFQIEAINISLLTELKPINLVIYLGKLSIAKIIPENLNFLSI